jgi:4a-hydroxytetrahydrobiopterin dehydratase
MTPRAAQQALQELHADWSLSADGKTIRREFGFRVFSRTMAFTNAVAWVASVEGHHPEMTVSYGKLVVAYRTTAIDGLSENDFICAAKIDRLATAEQG